MLNRLLPFLCCLFGLTHSGEMLAADSKQPHPTEVTADALRHDEQARLSVFTGHVVLTRGDLKITGDRLELQEDQAGEQTGIATGDLAHFERVREQSPNELIQGQASRIVYESKTNTLKLRGNGLLRRMRDGQLSDEVRGDAIDYFDETGVFSAQGQSEGDAGRVHIIIGPKPKQGNK